MRCSNTRRSYTNVELNVSTTYQLTQNT